MHRRRHIWTTISETKCFLCAVLCPNAVALFWEQEQPMWYLLAQEQRADAELKDLVSPVFNLHLVIVLTSN